MQKTVIVINGQGRSGKDTVCKILAKYYRVKNISTIDPIKAIAEKAGWNGEKDDKSRKMLADLKQIFIEYNDLPLNFVLDHIEQFKKTDEQIMFVHCREKEEIAKIVTASSLKTITLLIKRNDKYFENKVFGNRADDEVEDYDYDFIYNGNNETTKQLEESFVPFFENEIKPTLN